MNSSQDNGRAFCGSTTNEVRVTTLIAMNAIHPDDVLCLIQLHCSGSILWMANYNSLALHYEAFHFKQSTLWLRMSRSRRTTPDQRLALLRQRLKDLSPDTMIADLRLALWDESNFVVAQVAKFVREHTLSELIPDLVSAYLRFLRDGAECDKGCRAKLAIVEALMPLDFEEPDFWLAGMKYRQQEPVWNGSIDTAIDVRGVCAFGLVRSRLVAPSDLLIALTDLLADSEFVARAHAARAIAAAGLPGCVALLRLKASLGDSNSEVSGACFTGLLELDASRHVEFVAAFLQSHTDAAIEAALALGSSRNREAAMLLLKACQRCSSDRMEPFWISLGLSRQPEAVEFLISRINTASPGAVHAIRALAPIRSYDNIANRVLAAVQSSGSRELAAAHRTEFLPQPDAPE